MMKYQFQTDLGRKCRANKDYPALVRWVVKDFPQNICNELRELGWELLHITNDGTYRTRYAMKKGDEAIYLSDTGKAPYYCGDTQITLK